MHMDSKPENIVLSKDLSAILMDPSGIGGRTRKWLSPEMRLLLEPLSQDFEARKQNDIWTLGQILWATLSGSKPPSERLPKRLIKSNTSDVPLV